MKGEKRKSKRSLDHDARRERKMKREKRNIRQPEVRSEKRCAERS